MKVLESRLGKSIVGTMAGLYLLTQTATVLGKPNQNYVNYVNEPQAKVAEKADIPNYVGVKLNLPEPGYDAEKPLQLAYTSNISTRSDISDTIESEDVKKEEKTSKKKGSFWKTLGLIILGIGAGYAIYEATDNDSGGEAGSGGSR